MKKIGGFIKYPLKINLNKIAKDARGDQRYELSGVVVHWGTLEHGHYVSVVKKENVQKWFYCNDKNVG